MNPNICCTTGSVRVPSVSFVAIPTNWGIQTRAYSDGDCNVLRVLAPPAYQATVCHNDPDGFARLSGAGYGFSSRKRQADPTEECAAEVCTSSKEPDFLVLEDDTKYALADIPEPLIETLV